MKNWVPSIFILFPRMQNVRDFDILYIQGITIIFYWNSYSTRFFHLSTSFGLKLQFNFRSPSPCIYKMKHEEKNQETGYDQEKDFPWGEVCMLVYCTWQVLLHRVRYTLVVRKKKSKFCRIIEQYYTSPLCKWKRRINRITNRIRCMKYMTAKETWKIDTLWILEKPTIEQSIADE